MQNENDAKLFDDLVGSKLGHYVYALFDPATGYPFYIGKGGGKQGAGNRRIFEHFEEARKNFGKDKNFGKEQGKIARIQDIWETHGDVPWRIVRSKLGSDDEALLVESALIDMLREMNIPLTNKQSGHGSVENGMKSPADLRAWCAPKLNLLDLPPDVFHRPIFIFNISKGVADRQEKFPGESPEIYKEATCQFWKVAPCFRSMEQAMAVGCINGITRVALDIASWKEEGNRWEIIPDRTADGKHRRDTLTFKNVSVITEHCKGFWQRGNFLVVCIEDKSKIAVLRGSRNRTISLSSAAS